MTAVSDHSVTTTVVHGFMPDSVDHTVQELGLHSVMVVSADWNRVSCWVCWDLKDKLVKADSVEEEVGGLDQRP